MLKTAKMGRKLPLFFGVLIVALFKSCRAGPYYEDDPQCAHRLADLDEATMKYNLAFQKILPQNQREMDDLCRGQENLRVQHASFLTKCGNPNLLGAKLTQLIAERNFHYVTDLCNRQQDFWDGIKAIDKHWDDVAYCLDIHFLAFCEVDERKESMEKVICLAKRTKECVMKHLSNVNEDKPKNTIMNTILNIAGPMVSYTRKLVGDPKTCSDVDLKKRPRNMDVCITRSCLGPILGFGSRTNSGNSRNDIISVFESHVSKPISSFANEI